MFYIYFLGSFLSALGTYKTSLIQHSLFAIQNLFWQISGLLSRTLATPRQIDRRLTSCFFQFPFSLTYMNTFMLSSLVSCWTMNVHFCFSVFYLWLVEKAGVFLGPQWNTAVVHCFFRDNIQSSTGLQLQMWREKRAKLRALGNKNDGADDRHYLLVSDRLCAAVKEVQRI